VKLHNPLALMASERVEVAANHFKL